MKDNGLSPAAAFCFNRAMRVFVYEHLCATLPTAAVAWQSLRGEGQAMLTAFSDDLRAVPGIEVVMLEPGQAGEFAETAAQADFTLVIAPECDGILESLCRTVEQVGGRLLGPAADAVRLTADKLKLASLWKLRGVPTPPTRLALPQETVPHIFGPAVVKPRHGAGSLATHWIATGAEWRPALTAARSETSDDLIAQPFVPGRAVSVAWLRGPRQRLPLLPTAQDLSPDGRLHYRGGSLPLPPPLAERAVRLSAQAIEAVPGLLGYVGVDLVLGEAEDGSADVAIEVNPRPTTSYVGLRAVARLNLMETLLRVVQGEAVAAPCWDDRTIHFSVDGQVT
ncbi:MAG: ATP-grasp domain-containing protein [Planctomycetia bacterium]|nr:ATP-grasp domain-containing protein [Planctomycetia bacterium]